MVFEKAFFIKPDEAFDPKDKEPRKGSEIEPETMRLQPVGATMCGDGVPIE